MTTNTLYKKVLIEHYRNPCNFKKVDNFNLIRRGRNPRCGDELKIGVNFNNQILEDIAFQGRGCAVCIASASMMTKAVFGLCKADILNLYHQIKLWLEQDNISPTPTPLIELSILKQYPARKKCILLAWEALEEILKMD